MLPPGGLLGRCDRSVRVTGEPCGCGLGRALDVAATGGESGTQRNSSAALVSGTVLVRARHDRYSPAMLSEGAGHGGRIFYVRNAEVGGSSPLTSTTKTREGVTGVRRGRNVTPGPPFVVRGSVGVAGRVRSGAPVQGECSPVFETPTPSLPSRAQLLPAGAPGRCVLSGAPRVPSIAFRPRHRLLPAGVHLFPLRPSTPLGGVRQWAVGSGVM